MMVKFKDDSSRLQDEFKTKIDLRLQFLLLELAAFIWDRWQKQTTITCLLRTPTENDALPGSNPQSAHIRGDAADLRTHNYTNIEVDEIVKYVKHHWGEVVHCIFHNPGGNAPHIHININWPFSTKNFKV